MGTGEAVAFTVFGYVFFACIHAFVFFAGDVPLPEKTKARFLLLTPVWPVGLLLLGCRTVMVLWRKAFPRGLAEARLRK